MIQIKTLKHALKTKGQIYKVFAWFLCHKISVNSNKNIVSYPEWGRKREKCAKAQVAAGLRLTHLNVFNLVIMRKVTPSTKHLAHSKQQQIHKDCAHVYT